MIMKAPIHKDHLKNVKRTLERREGSGNEAEKMSIKNLYHQRLRKRVYRSQKWGRRHRRNRDFMNFNMIGNPKMFIGVFWWEIKKTQKDVSKKDCLGARIRKIRKSPEKVANSLITKAAIKRKKGAILKLVSARG